ncbi:sensor domain-containing diguanylate cyclase [Vibrio aquaticus]|uniref:diguanylate cyclase n=1 Tax=Vibrio aquaticus TaxID=2496559 RepID=A0A3S0V4G3_9VIBR|nr:sensor domain-containing diguanylate cyclase [Vibrio aquaticus]RTZ17527.1 sensor domain-containing diguanylate cyclase [Vibrio aquaticus]
MVRTLTILLFFFSAFAHVQEPSSQTLVIANSKAWKPFSFINNEGKADGILIDYWKEYGRKNNIKVEFLLLDWQSSLDAVKDGRADLHAGLLWSENRDTYLDYAPVIMSIDTQFYISQELIGIDLNDFMFGNHGYAIGVVKGGYEEEFTRLHFPNLNLIVYANNQEMIDAAFDGDLQGFVADLHVANFYLFTSNDPRRFIGVRHLYSGDLRAAVKEGNRALQKQVSEGMLDFTDGDKMKIFNRWMYVNTVYPEYFFHAIFVGVVLIGGTYIFVLRIAVKRKTQALEAANLNLKHLSETDQLTGLSNRRHFTVELKQRLELSGSVSICIFDIDDFKLINDRYGHQIGDDVIHAVASAARQVVPEESLLARIGGEEFAIVSNNLDYASAVNLAESVCQAVRELALVGEEYPNVTVSVGCAYYSKHTDSVTLSDADHLMYQSKQAGKDRVTANHY